MVWCVSLRCPRVCRFQQLIQCVIVVGEKNIPLSESWPQLLLPDSYLRRPPSILLNNHLRPLYTNFHSLILEMDQVNQLQPTAVALQLLYFAGRPGSVEKTSSLQYSLHMFDTNVEHLNGNLASSISLFK